MATIREILGLPAEIGDDEKAADKSFGSYASSAINPQQVQLPQVGEPGGPSANPLVQRQNQGLGLTGLLGMAAQMKNINQQQQPQEQAANTPHPLIGGIVGQLLRGR